MCPFSITVSTRETLLVHVLVDDASQIAPHKLSMVCRTASEMEGVVLQYLPKSNQQTMEEVDKGCREL